MSGLFASYASEGALEAALRRLRAAGFADFEIYTPMPMQGEKIASALPLWMLIAGVLGAAGGFLMQIYANLVGYPLDIGGRPRFAWPSYLPIAFELGALAAMLAGFAGFLLLNRMPHLYDPIDEYPPFAEATRAAWLIAFRELPGEERTALTHLLETTHPVLVARLDP